MTPLVYLIQLRENVASEATRPTPASACTCEEEVISRSEDSEVLTARFFLRKAKKQNKERAVTLSFAELFFKAVEGGREGE